MVMPQVVNRAEIVNRYFSKYGIEKAPGALHRGFVFLILLII